VINHPQENFFKIDNAAITDAHFSVIDENETPVDIDFTKLNTTLRNFYSMA
jgi:hypothetical protein